MEKSLTIQTHPNNVKIDYIGNDIVKIQLHSDLALCIEIDNSIVLHSKGDFIVSAEGEINLISQGSPICIDSIENRIYLNSRESKAIKNLPESIQYRKDMNKEDSKLSLINENEYLKNRITKVERKLETLIKILEIGEF